MENNPESAPRQPQGWQPKGLPRLLLAFALPVAATGGAAYLYWTDLNRSRPLMPCLFNWLTGLDCVGCGTTRALQALLHGDLAAAASFNLFMLVWLPLLSFALLGLWLKALTGKTVLPPLRDWRWLMIVLAASAVLFLIARNLPWAPFNWLAA
jgi:hypothetical protein